MVHGPDLFFPKMTRKLQTLDARIYRQEMAGSAEERVILGKGVPRELPSYFSGPVHGAATELS